MWYVATSCAFEGLTAAALSVFALVLHEGVELRHPVYAILFQAGIFFIVARSLQSFVKSLSTFLTE